jgi:hypothetical protein
MPKYKVPTDIQRIARRAIEQNLSLPMSRRAAYKDEDGKRVPGTGMRTARRLASGAIDEAQMKLMSAWFARHGEAEEESKARQDKTSKAALAWALWGGSPARRFVNAKLRELERERRK